MWRGNNMDKSFFKNHTEIYISSYKLFRVQLRECTIAGKFKNFNIFSLESNHANLLTDITNEILPTYINNKSGTDVRINIASGKYSFLSTLIPMYILTCIRKCICQPFKLLRIQDCKFQCTSKLFYRYLQSPYFFVFINMYV